MTCPRCRVAMIEEKRSFHKQRKWQCPNCGKVRMQRPKPDSKSGKSAGKGGRDE